MGSFNPVKAITRVFDVKPQSFTPANLVRDLSAGTIGVATAGQGIPIKINGTPIASASTHEASIVGAAVVGANSFGTVQAGDPNKPESTLDTIARLTGGAISSIAVGRAAVTSLNTNTALSPADFGPPRPLTFTESLGNALGSGINVGAGSYGITQVSQSIMLIFGQKVGGIILSLLSGNVKQAIDIFNSPSAQPSTTGQTQYILFDNSSGGGSGGGIGLSDSKSGQLQTSGVVFLIIGIILVGGLLMWKRGRK